MPQPLGEIRPERPLPSQKMTIYAGPGTLRQIEAGTHNFYCRTVRAVEGAGWSVDLREDDLGAYALEAHQKGYALYHMSSPAHEKALVCRRTYVGAFWRIEKSSQRWTWPIAHQPFEPDSVPDGPANWFFNFWKKRLFAEAPPVGDDGFILVPLQGNVFDQRYFQAMSPLEMIEATLAQSTLPILVTMHPKAPLSPQSEAALLALAARERRITIHRGGSMEALPRCRFVVTQYSSVALLGYFFEKPAVLFAEIDFQHIAGSVPRDGLEQAFASVGQKRDYARYLYWFLKLNSLNAGNEAFEENLLTKFRQHGWPI
ncbi:MAG TPA: hypothetical protein VLA27_04215 [Paracoccaceae bacterium]|nr:hypothetical protein [Paracoccaceae bacterium]